jgi:hypothetical protein
MLTYKAHLVGITVIVTAEAHKSKCSFLDNESMGIMSGMPANG